MFEKDNVVMFLRVVQGCNLNCSHCFTLGNQDKLATTPIEYIENFLSSIKKNVDPNYGVVYLHGGETFLAKLSYLRQVVGIARKYFQEDKFVIIPQTNLVYTVDQDYIDFIKNECGGNIGVSWDAKIRFGSIKTENQFRQEKLFFKNLKTLIDAGIRVYISIVVQKHLLKVSPESIAKMFEGVSSIDFEHLTVFNDKTQDLRANLVSWSDWLNELVDIYTTKEVSWCLPQIDLFTESMIEGRTYSCKCNCCDRKTFTLNPDGSTGFCPDNSYLKPVSHVNEMTTSWAEYETKSHHAHIERLSQLSTENCFSCEHYNECGGNCEDYLFDDSGECPLSKRVIARIKSDTAVFSGLLSTRARTNLSEMRDKGK